MSENLRGMTETQTSGVMSGLRTMPQSAVRGMSYPDMANSLKGQDSQNDMLADLARDKQDLIAKNKTLPSVTVTGPLLPSHPTVIKRAELAVEHVFELIGHDISEFDKKLLIEAHQLLLKLKIIRDKPVA